MRRRSWPRSSRRQGPRSSSTRQTGGDRERERRGREGEGAGPHVPGEGRLRAFEKAGRGRQKRETFREEEEEQGRWTQMMRALGARGSQRERQGAGRGR